MINLEHKIPPPVIAVLAVAVMWAISSYGPRVAIEADFKRVLIAVLVMIGIAFDVLGILTFRAARTTASPLKPERSSSLVTGGVYRITRNPMYVGLVFLLLAWAVHLSAVVSLVGIVLFIFYITRFQILPEERALARNFGEQYIAYCARVRRWL